MAHAHLHMHMPLHDGVRRSMLVYLCFVFVLVLSAACFFEANTSRLGNSVAESEVQGVQDFEGIRAFQNVWMKPGLGLAMDGLHVFVGRWQDLTRVLVRSVWMPRLKRGLLG